MKHFALFVFALSLLISQRSFSQAEPNWTAVPMPTFFDYSATTQSQPPANGPYSFNFPGMGANVNDTSGCYYNQFASAAATPLRPFWYINNTEASGVIPRHSPDVGVVFEDPVEVGTAMRGISFLGSFTPGTYTPYGQHLIGTVFWANEFCYDGTAEYGFAHYYDLNVTQFYFGSNQNCVNGVDGNGNLQYCYSNNSTSSALAIPCSGGLNFPNLQSSQGNTFYYNAFIFQDPNDSVYKFKVELIDPDLTNYTVLESCVIDPNKAGDPNNNGAGAFDTACTIAPTFSQNTCNMPGRGTFSAQPLYYNFGAITAGIDGGSPTPLANALQISVVKAGK